MELNTEKIAANLGRLLHGLPASHQRDEITMNNIAYFCVNGLAMIRKLDSVVTPELRSSIIDWVYSNQVPAPNLGGFRCCGCHETTSHKLEEMHLAMTYTSLAILLLLGDDLSRVDKPRVLEGLKKMQLPNGSFAAHPLGGEVDCRYIFCAAAITRMLGDTGEIDVERAIQYILSCQVYEGGFAYQPGGESHGGATYCAIAALDLWCALDRIQNRKLLAYWLSQRQEDGFNGRTHKLTDTCYSFWIGSPLRVLGWYDDIVDKERLTAFIFSNYSESGQFSPNTSSGPDIIHTHFSLAGLSLAGHPEVEKIHPSLGFVMRGLPKSVIGDKYQ